MHDPPPIDDPPDQTGSGRLPAPDRTASGLLPAGDRTTPPAWRPTGDRAAAGPLPAGDLEAEVRTLTSREMRHTLRFLLRARFAGAVVLTLLAGLWDLTEAPGWQAPFCLAAAGAVGVMAAWDFRRLSRVDFGPRDHAWLLASVMLIQTALIIPTGGAGSPAQVVYIPVATLAGVGLGRPALTWALVAAALVAVWTLAVLAALGMGPPPGPAVLGLTAAAVPMPPYVWMQAALLSFAIVIGAVFGTFHRRALDRAVRAASVARREALAAIDARHRELHDLSSTLAHELKNPLASIQGLAGLMARTLPDGSREAERASVLLGEARRMGGIVEELSSFARPARGLAARPLAPGRLAADVLTLHEGLAVRHGVTLLLDDGPAGGAEAAGTSPITADHRKLTQALVNLLQNALEATPPGGRITLRVRPRAGGGAVFEVDDTGPGVPEAMRGRLFADGATTKPAGSGLGLRIARAIAEQHGGSLRLEDRPGGGCRAVFEVPR